MKRRTVIGFWKARKAKCHKTLGRYIIARKCMDNEMRRRVKEMKKVQRGRHRFALKILGIQDQRL